MIDENSSRDEVLELVKKCGGILQYASNELKNDREVVMAAVKDIGFAFRFASHELREDKEIVMEATKTFPRAISWCGPLRGDTDFILELIKIRFEVFKYVEYFDMELERKKDFILKAVKINIKCLNYVDEKFLIEGENIYTYEYDMKLKRTEREFLFELIKPHLKDEIVRELDDK